MSDIPFADLALDDVEFSYDVNQAAARHLGLWQDGRHGQSQAERGGQQVELQGGTTAQIAKRDQATGTDSRIISCPRPK